MSTGSSQFVRVDLPDVNTVPEGGICTNCWDHFGRWIVLTTTWQRFTFRWDQLSQSGWGDIEASIDESALYSMQFLLQANASYTVWIDDIAFWR
jgi:endoglucanase